MFVWTKSVTSLFHTQEPDEFYEGITFEHFLKVGTQNTHYDIYVRHNYFLSSLSHFESAFKYVIIVGILNKIKSQLYHFQTLLF